MVTTEVDNAKGVTVTDDAAPPIPMALKNNMKLITKEQRDGWQNVMTQIGMKTVDKQSNTEFLLKTILVEGELTDLYRGEGIAKKIIDIPAQDMVREWFTVDGDTQNVVLRALDQIMTRQEIRSALKWARLYGGSIMVMGINDGTRGKAQKVLETPLNEERIKSIEFLKVYNRFEVHWDDLDIDNDAMSPNFGKPLLYSIFPSDNLSQSFKVHHTRVLRFFGERLPNRQTRENRGWGDSVLQSCFIRLRGFGETMISSEAILEEFIIGVMEIADLAGIVSRPNGGKDLSTRMQQIDQAKHILNTILVDKDEKYTRISANVNGIKDLLEFEKDIVSAVAEIPKVKLFGEQSKGIGAGAVGNIRMYYDGISDRQDSDLRPNLERLITLLIASQRFKKMLQEHEVKMPPTWRVNFRPLWKLTEKEIEEMRLSTAKRDDIYMKNGVLIPFEVAKARFGGETYSPDTNLLPEGDTVRKDLGLSPEAGKGAEIDPDGVHRSSVEPDPLPDDGNGGND